MTTHGRGGEDFDQFVTIPESMYRQRATRNLYSR